MKKFKTKIQALNAKTSYLFKRFPLLMGIVVVTTFIGAGWATANLGGFTKPTPPDLNDGLVAHYPFNGNANDETGNGNDGQLLDADGTNGDGDTPPQLTTDRHGSSNSAYEFDGVDDYIAFDDLNYLFNDQASLSFWVKLDNSVPGTSSKTGITRFGTDSNSHYPWTNGEGYFHTFRSSRVDNIPLSNQIDRTQWHMVTITTEPGTDGWKLYQNTELVYQVDGLSSVSLPVESRIGRSPGSHFLDGQFDDVRIYDRALSASEIEHLYTSFSDAGSSGIEVSGTQGELLGHWSFGEGFGVNDRTSNDNHATPKDDDTGNGDGDTPPQLTTDRRGEAESAYVLDGTDDLIGDISQTIEWGSQDYTTSIWFKLDSLTASGDSPNTFRIFFGGYSANFLDLETDTANFELSGEVNVNNERWDLGDTGVPKDLEWHLLTIQFTNGSVSGYMDGEHFNTIDTSGISQQIDINSLGKGNVDVGCCGSAYGDFWFGKFDDFRVYNKLLSQQEIKDMHESYKPFIQVSDLQKGLVGHWSFNNLANDVTPYDNHGNVNGATQTTDRRGSADRAYSFDGTDDWIDLSNGGANDIAVSGAMTVSLWFKGQKDGSNEYLMDNRSPGSWWWILDYSGGSCSNDSNNICFENRVWATGSDWNANEWTHVVVTDDTSTASMYVNGNLVDTGTGESSNISTNLRVGTRYSNTGHLNGEVDDVRVYNRALSAPEVEMLHETYR